MGCYIWHSEKGPGRAADPPSPLLAVPNVTAHPSTASVPITVLLYDGPLLRGFNVAIKGLNVEIQSSVNAALFVERSVWSSFAERHKRRSIHRQRSVGGTWCLAVAGHA